MPRRDLFSPGGVATLAARGAEGSTTSEWFVANDFSGSGKALTLVGGAAKTAVKLAAKLDPEAV